MTGPILTIGATPPQLVSFADYFDGHRAVPQRVGLRIDEAPTGAVLHLDLPDGGSVRWPLDQIRGIPDQADRAILAAGWTADPVARVIVADPETQAILRARCLNLSRRPPVKGKGKLMTWALAAVASVALIVFVLVPVMADQLAEYLPPAGEQALGDSTLEQIRGALSENRFLPMGFCERQAGTEALATMTAALTEGLDLPYDIKVHVLDSPIVNAFALPGGHVVFFRGLIDAAERPEEVAAVYAHELGHVVHRDPTRSALRSAGSVGVLGLLLGDFAGGTVVLFVTERLIDATYSQKAEAEADTFAHARMIATGLRPDALASMFERLQAKYGDTDEGFLKHFAAHPTLGNRIDAARRASEGMEAEPKELLSPAAWDDLKAICG